MRAFVHLVEGDDAAARNARIADLTRASRRPVTIFSEVADPPTSPLDWLLGPGCTCCLPQSHPRLRLLAAAEARSTSCRILIDAGPQALAERIARAIQTLPVPLRLSRLTA